MGLQTSPGYIGQGAFQTPVEVDRNLLAAIAGRRTGALRYGDFSLTPSGSAMQMTISRGDAILMGNAATTSQGAYYAWSDASETVNWPASAGSPRYDSLILRVVDLQYGSDAGGNRAFWEVVSGTPSGSPTVVPDSAFAVGGPNYRPGAWFRRADVLVPASVTNLSTATVNTQEKYARVGGRVLCSSTDLPSDAVRGDEAVLIDDQGMYLEWNGTRWQSIDGGGAWKSLSPYFSAGVQANSFGYAPAYKLQGSTVKLRGNIQKTTGTWTSPAQVLALPTNLRPASTCFFTAAATAVAAVASSLRVDIAATGVVNLTFTTNGATAYTPDWMSLDGIEYDVA